MADSADMDISDLPTPTGADIGDLPAPPSAPTQEEGGATVGQQLAAPLDTAATIGINTLAPVGAAAESLLTRRPYEEVRKKWMYSPTNPVTQANLQAIGNMPVLKQVGQVIGAASQKLSDATNGAVSPTEAGDAINTGLLGTGARVLRPAGAEAVAGATDAAAAASLPGVKGLWKINSADSLVNKYIINNAWAQQIGESGAFKLTQNVLNRANNRITAVFDYIRNSGRQYDVAINDTLGGIQRLADEHTVDLLNHPVVKRFIRDMKDNAQEAPPLPAAEPGVTPPGYQTPPAPAVTSKMNAEQLGDFSSQLGKAAKSTDRYDLKNGLFAMKGQIEDLIQAGLPDIDKTLYAKARAQYRALHGQLLANSSNLNTVTGNVNAANMGRFLQTADKSGYALGQDVSPGYQAARFGHGQAGSSPLPPVNSSLTAVLKAATKIGVPIQWLKQRSPQAVLQALGSNNTFRAALTTELRNAASGGSPDDSESEQ